MRLNVGFLLHESVGFSRKFDFEHESVTVGGELEVDRLYGDLRLTRTSQGLYGAGKLTAELPVECVRCLNTTQHALTVTIGDLFSYPPERGEDPLLTIPDTGILDLNPLLREYLFLEIPLRPLCRDDCKGLCPVCGNDLTTSTCEHPEAEIDPRLAPLQKLLSESS